LVYDTTIKESFERVDHWLKELNTYEPNCIVYLVGNKIDMDHQRQIKAEAVEGYCKKRGAIHMEVSAKMNFNVKDVFFKISEDILRKENTKPKPVKFVGGNERKGPILEVDNQTESRGRLSTKNFQNKDNSNKKKGCCSGG